MNLNDPVGGDAYGIPLNTSTGSKFRPSKCTIVPDTAPYFVWTILDVIWAWSLAGSLSSPPDENGNNTDRNQTINNIVWWYFFFFFYWIYSNMFSLTHCLFYSIEQQTHIGNGSLVILLSFFPTFWIEIFHYFLPSFITFSHFKFFFQSFILSNS